LIAWLSPEPKNWGLRNNEAEFKAQLVPNSPGIVTGFRDAVELAPGEVASRGRPGMVVKIRGVVHFGSQGSVDAPLSGMTCAWYRSYVTTVRRSWIPGGGAGRPRLQPLPAIAPSDMSSMRHGGAAVRKGLRAGAEISTVPFRVADRDGYVELDPRLTDVDTDVFGINQVVRPNRVDHCLLVEWVLPYAQPVTLLGTLGPDLTFLPGPDAALLVSTKDEQRILGRHRAGSHRHQRELRKLNHVGRNRVDAFNRYVMVFSVTLGGAAVLLFVALIVFAALQ